MLAFFDYDILKYTGKVGVETVVNSIAFKSVDTSTYFDDSDSNNYPVYAPYLTDSSYSFENWIKLRINLNKEFSNNLTSQGLIIQECVDGELLQVRFTKIKNICIWFNRVSSSSAKIKFGSTNQYVRPTDSPSNYAVENIALYVNKDYCFDDTIKYPLYFNGKNEIDIVNINDAKSDGYLVWQLEILKGLQYQLDNRLLNIKIHYELE